MGIHNPGSLVSRLLTNAVLLGAVVKCNSSEKIQYPVYQLFIGQADCILQKVVPILVVARRCHALHYVGVAIDKGRVACACGRQLLACLGFPTW